jgi:hypothetical protein
MRTFEAMCGFWDDGDVWVIDDNKRVARLDPHFETINHSPTGFAWGYGGSGPAQLAFAILACVIGVKRASDPHLYQNYRRQVIERLDQKAGFAITEQSVIDWCREQTALLDAIEEGRAS